MLKRMGQEVMYEAAQSQVDLLAAFEAALRCAPGLQRPDPMTPDDGTSMSVACPPTHLLHLATPGVQA